MAAGGAILLVTDGGPHPARKWAEVLANDLVRIEPTASRELAAAGAALRESIITATIPHFEEAQAAERDGRHDLECHCDPHVDEMIEAIKEAAAKTQFADHFDQDHVLEHMLHRCSLHTRTAMHIENLHAEAANAPEANTSDERA